MKLARPPKGEIALGFSSSTCLVSPKSEVISVREALCGVGSGVSSIYTDIASKTSAENGDLQMDLAIRVGYD